MRETKRTALDELSDLLDDLPMTGLQRHWADEYLRDLRDSYLEPGAQDELEDLRYRMSNISDLAGY